MDRPDTVAPWPTRAPSDDSIRQEGRGWKFYVLGSPASWLVFVIQNSQSVKVKFLFT